MRIREPQARAPATASRNPVTHLIDAARGLIRGRPVAEQVIDFGDLAVLTAAFAPVTIAPYRRRS